MTSELLCCWQTAPGVVELDTKQSYQSGGFVVVSALNVIHW